MDFEIFLDIFKMLGFQVKFSSKTIPKNTVSFTCSIGEPSIEKARSYFCLFFSRLEN